MAVDHGAHFRPDDAVRRLAGVEDRRVVEVFRHGTLLLKLYAPRGVDPQQPHAQDEVYVVVRGSGMFFDGKDRYRFQPGDMLFVPAGCVHRFEDFSDDLAVWVVFYGPEGGEAARHPP